MGGRLSPCCCLIRNIPAFRRVVDLIGFSCASTEQSEGSKTYDTFGLMTQVMKTHGMNPILSSKMVLHFFEISCGGRTEEKEQQCMELLNELRDVES